jgi:hypothetical protein
MRTHSLVEEILRAKCARASSCFSESRKKQPPPTLSQPYPTSYSTIAQVWSIPVPRLPPSECAWVVQVATAATRLTSLLPVQTRASALRRHSFADSGLACTHHSWPARGERESGCHPTKNPPAQRLAGATIGKPKHILLTSASPSPQYRSTVDPFLIVSSVDPCLITQWGLSYRYHL